MSYQCEIIADSVGKSHGVRITTFQVTFPRFILAEVNTHCALSRNSASSRAIPPEKIIDRVMQEPFVPSFNKRVKGMGVGESLGETAQAVAQGQWLKARDAAVDAARQLLLLDVDKSRVNRLLEPFMWHTAIITATDWANFYGQRFHPEAQNEFQRIAEMMHNAQAASEPEELEPGEWHLPMVASDEKSLPGREPALVSAGRVARVSFDNHWKAEAPDLSIGRAERLITSKPGHWSPTEHPAVCLPHKKRSHKYRGWMPLRKLYPNEVIKD